MSTESRVRELPPLRFQALALILLRKEFGNELEDVRDTAGEGNGCDGILVQADHVEGFQIRTMEHELGASQRQKARSAIDLALSKVPVERGLPLTKFMFVFNLDLQPSEAQWFTGQKATYGAKGCELSYRALGWVVSQLLDDGNNGIRREFIETESDRQLEILKALAIGGTASQDALTQIVNLVKGLDATGEAKRALETLLERAKFHFDAGIAGLAQESFRKAQGALAEARELLSRHHDDPLYVDVVYWHAIALLSVNDWAGALPAFEEAAQLYARVGRVEEARWARGNSGHALRGLGRHSDALAIFESTSKEWANTNDTYNILAGLLNEAELHMELQDLRKAATAFAAGKAIAEKLSAPDILRLDLFELIIHFLGSFSTFYYTIEDDASALSSLDSAIAFARMGRKKHLLGKLLSSSITPLAFTNRLDEAIQRSTEAEGLLLDIGDEHSLGRLYNNLGVAYAAHNQNAKACEYLARDYAICRKLGDVAGATKTLQTMNQFGCPRPASR